MRLRFGWTLWFTFTAQLSAGKQPERGNPLAEGGGGSVPPLPLLPSCHPLGLPEGPHVWHRVPQTVMRWGGGRGVTVRRRTSSRSAVAECLKECL